MLVVMGRRGIWAGFDSGPGTVEQVIKKLAGKYEKVHAD
jgi:hypothetical protein